MFDLFEEVALYFVLGRYINTNHLSKQSKVGFQILFFNFTDNKFYHAPKHKLYCLLDFICVVSISVNGSFILEFKDRFTFCFKLFIKVLLGKRHRARCLRSLDHFLLLYEILNIS